MSAIDTIDTNSSVTEPSSAMLPRERRAVAAVAFVGSLRMFGLFALLPVLSIYAAGLDGATPLLVGLSVGAYGLTQALLQIPLGALSDRVGRRPVIVGGLLVFAAGSLVAAASAGIAGVIAGRLLQGAGAISSTLTALVADLTRPVARTRSMGIYGAGVGSSILLALVFGPVIAGGRGVPALFVVTAALAILAAIIVLTLRLAPSPVGARQAGFDAARPRVPFRAVLTPPLLRLDAYIFLLHAILTALFVALPFILRDRAGFALADHWQLYVAALILSLAGTVPLVLADDRRGKRATVHIALGLKLAGLLVLALVADTLPLILLGMALVFAGLNFLEAALPARLTLLADESRRGASLGVFSSAQFSGAFAGGLAGGWLLSSGSPNTVVFAAAALVSAWIVLHGTTGRTENPAESPQI